MREPGASPAQANLGIASRRGILGGGVAFLTLGLTPSWSKPMLTSGKSDLFVFKAPASNNCVFAVVFPERRSLAVQSWPPGTVVQVHAGPKSWTVPVAPNERAELNDARSFVGQVHFSSQDPSAMRVAVVIEATPQSVCPGESLGVWAEVRGKNGSRSRLGNPVVAEIMARDPSLSEIYHRIAPEQDRAVLADALARRLAAMSIGTADPQAHGRRLASLLLPDVIRYQPGAPVGFNFADRNGRHPADPVEAVVETLLAGAVIAGGASGTTRLGEEFPYFSTGAVVS